MPAEATPAVGQQRLRVIGAMSTWPTWLRAAVITSVQTFVGTFLVTLLGLLGQVQDWVGGGEPPDLTAPAKAVASAVVALVVGVVTALYRAVKPPEATYNDGGN